MAIPALLPLLLLAQIVPGASGPSSTAVVPPGTPLWIKSDRRVPLRTGQIVSAHLQYGIYAENRLVLPAGTRVEGHITALAPDRPHRLQARLRADFTPFSRPVVQFDRARLGGAWLDLQVSQATEGAPVLQLTPPPPRTGGLLRREWNQGKILVKDRLRVITAPGKKERLQQLLYSQLPYHPQSVPAETVWTVDTTSPLTLQTVAEMPSPPAGPQPQTPAANHGASADQPKTWTLQAYLAETVTSENAKTGMPITAVVAQPVLGAEGDIEVPEGAVLKGQITHARAAKRFGRAGELRFDFRELTLPGQNKPREVQTTLSGLDAVGDANLSLDREGQVQPKPKDKIVVPFILLNLAGRPLDRDRGDNAFGKDAVASNSLGVIGFLVGTAGGWRNVAAGLGYYGSAIAIWNRWIKKGADTTLRHDTRLVLQTTARRSEPMGNGNTAPASPTKP